MLLLLLLLSLLLPLLRRLLSSSGFLLLGLRRVRNGRGRHGLDCHGLNGFLELATERRVGARHDGFDVAQEFFLPGLAATRKPPASRAPRAALTLRMLHLDASV